MNDKTKNVLEQFMQPGSSFISNVKWVYSDKKANVIKFDFPYNLITTPMFYKLVNRLATHGIVIHYDGFQVQDTKKLTLTCW